MSSTIECGEDSKNSFNDLVIGLFGNLGHDCAPSLDFLSLSPTQPSVASDPLAIEFALKVGREGLSALDELQIV